MPSKEIELIEKIAAKTLQGKIPWKVGTTALTASVGNKLEISFVRDSPLVPFLGKQGWALFSVRDKQGSEILKISGTAFSPLAVLGGVAQELTAAVDKLYAAVITSYRSEIDKAMDIVDSA